MRPQPARLQGFEPEPLFVNTTLDLFLDVGPRSEA
jgi:hypothetical protein